MQLFVSLDDDLVDVMGFHLDTPTSKRLEFQMTYRNCAQRKEAYLDYYVHSHPAPSWTKVAKTLHGHGLRQQTTVVENTYIKGTSPIIALKLMW